MFNPLRYSHCGAILSTAPMLGINPTIKIAIMKIEGIIVGKAIFDGDIKLEELVKEID